jgi:hypothetical protein
METGFTKYYDLKAVAKGKMQKGPPISSLPSTVSDIHPYAIWGINESFPIARCAADFYLMEKILADCHLGRISAERADVTLPEVESIQGPLVASMSKAMADILMMAIGGELRHWNKVWYHPPADEIVAQANNMFAMHLSGCDDSVAGRLKAYRQWHSFVVLTGRGQAAQLAVDLFFMGEWGSAYGGKKWGSCAEAIVRYERGIYSGKTFVDTSLGLEHNNNNVFDKVWSSQIPALKSILDDNQNGCMDRLIEKASDGAKTVWMRTYPDYALSLIKGEVTPTFRPMGTKPADPPMYPKHLQAKVTKAQLEAASGCMDKHFLLTWDKVCVTCPIAEQSGCEKVHLVTYNDHWFCFLCGHGQDLLVTKLPQDYHNKNFAVCTDCLGLAAYSGHVIVGDIVPGDVGQKEGAYVSG